MPNIYNCSISEFIVTGGLTKLRWLRLSENALSSLPDSTAKLSSLVHLDLSHNKFAEIPEVLMDVASLASLIMQHNEIRNISDAMCGFTLRLCKLDVRFNEIVDIPVELMSSETLFFGKAVR